MNVLTRVLVVAAVLVGFSGSPAAQWPDHKAARAPRLPDGKVDVNGPAPRTADGKPDLSGTYRNVGRPAGSPRETLSLDEKPLATFRDIGAGFKDGLPLRPWAKELLDKRNGNNSKDNPDVWCLPLGNQQFNVHTFPRKVIQAADMVLLLYETHQGIRQIHMDGRPLPTNDPQPWFYGYSVGRWDGDTLVVETAGFKDGGWLDIIGSPLTEQGRTIERFRRPNFGTIEIEQTIDDPKAYTRPFTTKLTWRLMPDTDIMEMVCLENNQSIHHLVGADGPVTQTGPSK
ncbi:MAG TPA: hypothetical protein VI485_22305 [Vicinamibacterales bacterium]|nr:hypothetical protein [Vicinamibacterales bacterium]